MERNELRDQEWIVKIRVIGTGNMPVRELNDLTDVEKKKIQAHTRSMRVRLHNMLYGYKQVQYRKDSEKKVYFIDGALQYWDKLKNKRYDRFKFKQVDDATFSISEEFVSVIEDVIQRLRQTNEDYKKKNGWGSVITFTKVPYSTANEHLGLDNYERTFVRRR